jgi:hypothetical protein
MMSGQNREVNSEEIGLVYSTGGISISRTKRLPDGWFPSQPPNKKMLFATTVAVCPYLSVRKRWTTYAIWKDQLTKSVTSVNILPRAFKSYGRGAGGGAYVAEGGYPQNFGRFHTICCWSSELIYSADFVDSSVSFTFVFRPPPAHPPKM